LALKRGISVKKEMKKKLMQQRAAMLKAKSETEARAKQNQSKQTQSRIAMSLAASIPVQGKPTLAERAKALPVKAAKPRFGMTNVASEATVAKTSSVKAKSKFHFIGYIRSLTQNMVSVLFHFPKMVWSKLLNLKDSAFRWGRVQKFAVTTGLVAAVLVAAGIAEERRQSSLLESKPVETAKVTSSVPAQVAVAEIKADQKADEKSENDIKSLNQSAQTAISKSQLTAKTAVTSLQANKRYSHAINAKSQSAPVQVASRAKTSNHSGSKFKGISRTSSKMTAKLRGTPYSKLSQKKAIAAVAKSQKMNRSGSQSRIVTKRKRVMVATHSSKNITGSKSKKFETKKPMSLKKFEKVAASTDLDI
jgi:hypothetical protein